jgi:phosphoribosyl 1,2-cyclic phosphodiesterase
MKVRFWGTRGSIPTPGKTTVRYGGNTPCVEVRLRNNGLIILDAGTGIRGLGDQLLSSGKSVKAVLAITHPHWDHIQGFPFFKPFFISGNEFTIIGPQSKRWTLRKVISDIMNQIYFPIQLNELKAKVTFRPMREGSVDLPGATLTACYVNHPSLAFGYRVSAQGRSVVYISDNEPFDREVARSVKNVDKVVMDRFAKRRGDPNEHVFEFARGADVLIHDTTYTPEEYVNHVGWGHSHYLFALKVAEEARVKKLVLFHHDHTHDDNQIEEILNRCRWEIKNRNHRFECIAASEGLVLEW